MNEPPTSSQPLRPSPPGSGRPRLLETRLTTEPGSHATVRVKLERDGSVGLAERSVVGEEALLLRTTALATLEALHQLLGSPDRFQLIGVKRILAFDQPVVLVCLGTTEGKSQKLVGSVPVGESPVAAVAEAILHATNRRVEALPPSEEAGLTEREAGCGQGEDAPESEDDPDGTGS